MNDNNSHVVDHQNDNDHNHTHSPTSPSSISQKLCNMSCCFRNSKHQQPISPVHVSKTRLLHSSSVWIRSRAHADHHLPEIKGKCRTLISRIGHRHRHSRRHSAEFHYDALSYSRNFDDQGGLDDDLAFPFKSFSSRLPPSPPLEDVREHVDGDDEPRSKMASSSASALISESKTTEIVSAYS